MRDHRPIVIAFFITAFFSSPFARAETPPFEPTGSYSKEALEGWPIYISRAFGDEHKDLLDRTLAELRAQLFEITRVVPNDALARLREVPIWVEYRDRDTPCMCYHPSKEWLSGNGYNPDKEKGVEIAHAETFLKWTHDQPWMVLHELAHSYHDRVLNFDNAEVKSAYEAAVKSGQYKKVLHINGRHVDHYALTNEKEYFAECSEAYFGTNDFYPFVRAELVEVDPAMAKLLEKLWGKRKTD